MSRGRFNFLHLLPLATHLIGHDFFSGHGHLRVRFSGVAHRTGSLCMDSHRSWRVSMNEGGFPLYLTCIFDFSFGEKEAREYVDKLLPDSTVDDLSWKRVFEVCGGNAGQSNSYLGHSSMFMYRC